MTLNNNSNNTSHFISIFFCAPSIHFIQIYFPSPFSFSLSLSRVPNMHSILHILLWFKTFMKIVFVVRESTCYYTLHSIDIQIGCRNKFKGAKLKCCILLVGNSMTLEHSMNVIKRKCEIIKNSVVSFRFILSSIC